MMRWEGMGWDDEGCDAMRGGTDQRCPVLRGGKGKTRKKGEEEDWGLGRG